MFPIRASHTSASNPAGGKAPPPDLHPQLLARVWRRERKVRSLCVFSPRR